MKIRRGRRGRGKWTDRGKTLLLALGTLGPIAGIVYQILIRKGPVAKTKQALGAAKTLAATPEQREAIETIESVIGKLTPPEYAEQLGEVAHNLGLERVKEDPKYKPQDGPDHKYGGVDSKTAIKMAKEWLHDDLQMKGVEFMDLEVSAAQRANFLTRPPVAMERNYFMSDTQALQPTTNNLAGIQPRGSASYYPFPVTNIQHFRREPANGGTLPTMRNTTLSGTPLGTTLQVNQATSLYGASASDFLSPFQSPVQSPSFARRNIGNLASNDFTTRRGE